MLWIISFRRSKTNMLPIAVREDFNDALGLARWLAEDFDPDYIEQMTQDDYAIFFFSDAIVGESYPLVKVDKLELGTPIPEWVYEQAKQFGADHRPPVKTPTPIFTGLVSGRAMCRHLVSLGVPAQKIVRKQETGDYVADFFVPEMQEPVAPAEEWAKQIQAALPSAQIIDIHNTRANWRPGNPVIYSTVIFRLEEKENS